MKCFDLYLFFLQLQRTKGTKTPVTSSYIVVQMQLQKRKHKQYNHSSQRSLSGYFVQMNSSEPRTIWICYLLCTILPMHGFTQQPGQIKEWERNVIKSKIKKQQTGYVYLHGLMHTCNVYFKTHLFSPIILQVVCVCQNNSLAPIRGSQVNL